MWLFLALIVVPGVEVTILVALGYRIGVLPTLGLLVIMGMLGSLLLRTQGASTWRRTQAAAAAGEIPTQELLEGLCLFAAGVLLVLPGVLSDVVGLLLLVPPIRRRVARHLARRFQVRVAQGPGAGPTRGARRTVIDLPPTAVRPVAADGRGDGR